jgi:hypothetical protein
MIADRRERASLLIGSLGACVSTRRFGRRAHEVVRDERCAEALDLLAGGRPDVERRDNAAEPTAGGDGLKSCDAGADHEHLCRRDVARGGRQHG